MVVKLRDLRFGGGVRERALGSSEEGKNVSETAFLLFWRFDFHFFSPAAL